MLRVERAGIDGSGANARAEECLCKATSSSVAAVFMGCIRWLVGSIWLDFAFAFASLLAWLVSWAQVNTFHRRISFKKSSQSSPLGFFSLHKSATIVTPIFTPPITTDRHHVEHRRTNNIPHSMLHLRYYYRSKSIESMRLLSSNH
jgi:hypothetical protein